ncbi:hypothetical protein HMPREF1977_0471 [Capnocytophaga ochracea F0287]|uniref:Uncharacterized protein n=1 Tax=Capnocytophaga ochracea F0287 TaxID=873517 RepID=E4MQ11_CAPOC|nr:SIR2 family protein [Capnocytophaga ochracea]EFS98254.1 hypothetical protein HMPREF1977_0471 [Capnocytophaga ochracea F0287]EJF44438.1 SIR2-like domain protein [Capnocytophaga ochracea str. Holt 25]UEB43501.1 SIR2 family protein [Capnocytophaga ochracea]
MEENTKKNDTKKYILLQNNYTVAYDDENYYVNNKVQDSKKDGDKTPTKEDIEKQANDLKIQQLYNSFLRKHFKNIVVLTGAGSSKDSGGKLMGELWEECNTEIESLVETLPDIKNKSFYDTKPDIEAFISYITLIEKTADENKASELKKGREELEKKIRELCTLTLQKDKAPHIDFLNKITARKNNDSRVQIFTTNYDTLFEQAANEAGFVIIDGFSFTQPREFSGRWFDLDIVNREKTRLKQEESFISKVFHLYKLHGSLTWTKKDDGKIVQENSPNPLMIYPSSEKYESSYEQPYFEMMSRFQQALRKEETLLIVIGFGFGDKHIRNVVLEAVNQNPSFQLLILNYGNITPNENIKDFFINKENFVVKRNINIVSGSFKEFTDNYPENKTYYNSNESI